MDKNKNPFPTSDTASKTLKVQSPKKAALLSLLPGAGQFYNKKYWKMPVIYAALAGLGYIAYYNNNQYLFFRNTESTWIHENPGQENSPYFVNIQTNKNDYQHAFDLDLIAMAAVYLLNIVDAAVDAHMFTFDVSKDLSMKMTPDFLFCGVSNTPQARFLLTLKF